MTPLPKPVVASVTIASVRKLSVFALGGTIAMAHGQAPSLGASDLVAALPGLADVELEAHDFRALPGASLRLEDLAAVVAAAHERVAAGIDGVVITQGTDTIEESAFAMDLWWRAAAPLVVTGAMRNPTQAGADGPANVLAAVATAAAPEASGLGCLVVLADEIHAAERVRKTHTTSPGAFRSPDTGPIGYLAEGRPRFLTRPAARRAPLPAPVRPPSEVRTAVVPMLLGDDGVLLRACGSLDGLVVAGFGVGHVPEVLVEPLAALAGRMPVVLASRVGAGPVLAATYAFAGSESDLVGHGLIGAGALDCYKARVLLHLLLAAGAGRAEIAAAFAGPA